MIKPNKVFTYATLDVLIAEHIDVEIFNKVAKKKVKRWNAITVNNFLDHYKGDWDELVTMLLLAQEEKNQREGFKMEFYFDNTDFDFWHVAWIEKN